MLSKMLRLFCSKRQPSVMTPEDVEVIRRLASGDTSARLQAVAIHRQYIPLLGVRGTPEQDFMAEVDNPVPDLGLRSMYRTKLLSGKTTNA